MVGPRSVQSLGPAKSHFATLNKLILQGLIRILCVTCSMDMFNVQLYKTIPLKLAANFTGVVESGPFETRARPPV